ncbi:MAG: hypothetical protein P1V51_02300 [Deltaproteobacteria bacterium]|nr:hypothetical protein [Deltaproteobacteria bacterium]
MTRLAPWLAALVVCAPGGVRAQEEAAVDVHVDVDVDEARDAEIFGEASAEAEADAEAREDEIFGDGDGDGAPEDAANDLGLAPGLSDADIGVKLDEAEDPLAIGGRLYLRLDWTALEEGYPEDFSWSTPALMDLYLDARPNERLRAFVKGRLSHDFTARGDEVGLDGSPVAPTRVMLDQLWVKWDLSRTLFLTVGQQPLRWGSGRFWNPTDFLNKRFKDPLAVFDERLGLPLVKLHLPLESLGWNLYAIADFDGARIPEDVTGAFRAEALFGTTELALSAAVGKDEPLRLGADVTTGLWVLDLRLETALLHGVKTPYFEGEFDLAGGRIPTLVDRSDDWIVRVTAGAELGINLNDEDALYLGVEYFYNGMGYEGAGLYPWLLAYPYLQAAQGLSSPALFTPFYLGRHYASFYAALPAPGRWDDVSFTLSALSNLSDRSVVARLDFSVQLVTYLRLNAYFSQHLGQEGELRFGMEVPPLPVEGLEQGFRVVPPLLDLGVGLTLTL